MLRRVTLGRTDVSGELITFIMTEKRICELRTSLAITSNQEKAKVVRSSPIPFALMMEAISSHETLVLTTDIWRNIPEYGILHSQRRENLKSYKELTGTF
jgi:hypothetical protein